MDLSDVSFEYRPRACLVRVTPPQISASDYCWGGDLFVLVQPVDGLDAIHHCRRRCLFHRILLNVGAGTALTAVVDGADLVARVNGQGAWAEIINCAAKSLGCLLL